MKYKCDYCKKEFNVKPSRIQRQKTVCCSRECGAKLKSIAYKGDKNPNYGNKGENSKLFKDKTIITDKGYVKIYKPDHAMSDNYGRIFEHRYLAEKFIAKDEHFVLVNGIKVLNPNLDVHHIDKNKTNNEISNLKIISRKEHAELHQGFKHRESLVKNICKNCNKEYFVIKSRKTKSKFCSNKCNDEYSKKDMIESKCPICGNLFLHNKNQFRRCCSVKCSNKFLNRASVKCLCDR